MFYLFSINMIFYFDILQLLFSYRRSFNLLLNDVVSPKIVFSDVFFTSQKLQGENSRRWNVLNICSTLRVALKNSLKGKCSARRKNNWNLILLICVASLVHFKWIKTSRPDFRKRRPEKTPKKKLHNSKALSNIFWSKSRKGKILRVCKKCGRFLKRF